MSLMLWLSSMTLEPVESRNLKDYPGITKRYWEKHNVGLVSIAENIDYSRPEGMLFTPDAGGFRSITIPLH